ncbi:MAG: DNA-protecting protein DprA [Bacteroidota bacterium]|jgi:DNA processing protein
MENQSLLYKIAFSQLHGVGPIRARRLLHLLKEPSDFFEADFSTLSMRTGVSEKLLRQTNRDQALLKAKSQIPYLEKSGIRVCFITDPDYPKRLAACEDAPILFFYYGQFECLHQLQLLAIVGTRKNTAYGNKLVEQLVAELPKNVVVVSGLAAGIDAQVHRACLTHQLRTVGILGHGLDHIYPAAHRQLAAEMCIHGGLLSEFLMGTKPERMHFPMRNRIIAGLVDAVVVTESPLKGGSMITADLANDYDREVFAFPGSIQEVGSEGPHLLIKQHKAHLLTDCSQLLDTLNWTSEKKRSAIQQRSSLSPLQQEIFNAFTHQACWTIDALSTFLKQPVDRISATLFELELTGQLLSKAGNQYVLPL